MKLPFVALSVVVGLSCWFDTEPTWSQTSARRYAPRVNSRLLLKNGAVVEAASAEPVAGVAAESADGNRTAKETPKTPEQQQRLQKIQQLKFDRRPSAILRVWNQYEKERFEKKQEATKKAEEKKSGKKKIVKKSKNDASDKPKESGEAKEAENSDKAESEEKSAEDKPEQQATPGEEVTEETEEAESESADAESKEGDAPAEEAKSEDTDAAKKEEQAKRAEEAKAKLEEAKKKAEEAAKKVAEFDQGLKDLQRDVTLSRWPQVAKFIGTLEKDEAAAVYEHLVRTLASARAELPPDAPPELQAQMQQALEQQAQRGLQPETNAMSADDLIAIIGLAPKELDEKTIQSLSGLVRVYLANGYLIDDLAKRMKEESDKPEKERKITPQQVGELFVAANQTIQAKEFLPTIEDAVAKNNHVGLILLSKYYLAMYQKDRKTEDLELAWKSLQEVLAAKDVEETQQVQALQRAVDLAPQVSETLGESWLAESFTGQPQRGIDIIATIGGTAARALQTKIQVPNDRLNALKLQTTAVEALVAASPELASKWSDKLTLLAQVWLREAEVSYKFDTSTSRGPALQRDVYGNFFYYDMMQQQQQQQNSPMRAIPVNDILKTQPSEKWLKYVSDDLKPKVSKVLIQLFLKLNEEDKAFPYIEQLATTHPALADELVKEFLRVWTDNHDPNANRNRTNSYMYMYGFERRAESIPLTRSKQERNLKELAALVKRLNALPLEDVDQEQLVKAFTTCHSSAEVYRKKAIEEVFGPVKDLDPKTLAALGQQMRTNLLGLWRAPAVQNTAKTNRKQRDIEAEVQRGYGVAVAVVQNGLQAFPDDWNLVLAKASLAHDINDYRRTISPDSKFVDRQEDAFADFRRAAELYSASVGTIKQNEETTKPFEVWYYASMGACDPDRIDHDKPRDPKQLPLIRKAILALPGEAAERHMAMFANTLFTRMSSVKPALKYRYLESGLAITGDHERALEAQKVFDYYSDLVTEIELETKIDGSDKVGHGKPFGVFVNLVHTREIERESGGFTRYLQNQNNGNSYYYNYGRPLENYRDKFEEQVAAAMGDQFEIMSVTFQGEDVNSRSLPRDGWRYTPYAYVLLKAKGPEADKLPSLQLDLDFLDTSGYAVIPIASPPLPIDASPKDVEPRPANIVSLTQTLDERHAEAGKLLLEVKASAQGLVPELDKLVKVAPEGFDVTEVEDEGLSVSHFDPDSAENAVLSERTWLISMQAKEGAPIATSFEFGETLVAKPKEEIYQRYDDADLAKVDRKIDLKEKYASTDINRYLLLGATAALLLAGLAVVIIALSRRKKIEPVDEFAIPERITPFSVLNLLDRIDQRNGLDATGREKLRESKSRIEQFYFVDGATAEPDLEEIATMWARQATSRNGHGS